MKNQIPVTGKQPPKYVQTFVLKIIQCSSCKATIGSPEIEVYPQPEQMILKAEAVHREQKPLCLAPKLIIIFDTAFIDSGLILSAGAAVNNSHLN